MPSYQLILSSSICAILLSCCVAAFDQLQLQSGCDPLPLTVETWQKLKLDQYISNYPTGENLTVSDYASQLNSKNFRCGISEWCNAGQMCYPVKGLDWYVLFAIQEWNERMNNLNNAIGFSMSLLQANLLSLISALFPQPNNLHIFSQKTHLVGGAALASLVMGLLVLLPLFGVLPTIVLVPSVLVILASGSTKYKEVAKDSFTLASELNYQITNYQQQIQENLRNQTYSLLNTGISKPEGMAGALAGGSYLEPKKFPSLEKMENEIRNITLAISVSYILKSLNAFVTIGSDPCKSSGKNGAWAGNDVLSYCDAKGTMFNIVTVSPGKSKVKNKIPNASILSTKFGITTEYLISSVIDCHEKRKNLHFFSNNSTLTTIETNQSLVCPIEIPVCDCRTPGFYEKKKKIGTVMACRETGVPIN